MRQFLGTEEQTRLTALHNYNILDTPPEEDFDNLVKLTAKTFKVPISTVTLVDNKRQWFKSSIGLEVTETPRDISFCTHVISEKKPLIVEDTSKDNRFSTNPLVTHKPNIVFYAGIPLFDSSSNVLGTLCIMGNKKRKISDSELEILQLFADQAMKLLESRHEKIKLKLQVEEINQQLKVNEQRWMHALEGAEVGVWDWNIKTNDIYYSEQWKKMLGYDKYEIASNFKAWISLVHPDDVDFTLTSLTSFLNSKVELYSIEHRLLCKDNSWKWILSRGLIVENDTADGTPIRMVGTHTDITDQKISEELIWNQANFDQLTGLPNRRLFFYRLMEEIKRSTRLKSKFALLFLDLDAFSTVNEQYGHPTGDYVLIESAMRIKRVIRESDTFARIGGDEFSLIISLNESDGGYTNVAQNIIDTISASFLIVDESCQISVSIGIALFPYDGETADALLNEAEKAMNTAKFNVKNKWYKAAPS